VEPVKESQTAIFHPSFTRGRNDTQKGSFSDRFGYGANNQRRRTTDMGK
jgi:hypothetical protein